MRIDIEISGGVIETEAIWHGEDLLVSIRGGSRMHIGCTSTCWHENGELRLGRIPLPCHRDDVIADKFAKNLAQTLGTTVCAVCGIHYDNADPQLISEIVEGLDGVLERLCTLLPQEAGLSK